MAETVSYQQVSSGTGMSGMDLSVELSGMASENGTFLRLTPTSVSTAAAAAAPPSPGRPESVYVYVLLFLSLLLLLLSLLLIALHRLKNIISSSSSPCPEVGSQAGSSFTNMEICSLSSQRSTVSSLSS